LYATDRKIEKNSRISKKKVYISVVILILRMNLLTELNQDGTTIVMVTHSSTDAEKALQIVQLFDGHMITENIKTVL
jgi:hypothetical protein